MTIRNDNRFHLALALACALLLGTLIPLAPVRAEIELRVPPLHSEKVKAPHGNGPRKTLTSLIGIQVPMRDGVCLNTDVYLPDCKGSFPVIVIRLPYNGCAGRDDWALGFVRKGYGFVLQDCRGTGTSDGVADYWRQERLDSEDFLAWIEKQPWFNGRLVTNGESYPGADQWQIARTGSPVVVGITPHNAPLTQNGVIQFRDGIMEMGIMYNWAFNMVATRRGLHKPDFNKLQWHLPVRTMDAASGLGDWPLWREWVDHSSVTDSFWTATDIHKDISKIKAPAYITGGWFDPFLKDTLRAFTEMRDHAGSKEARAFTRCCIEPLDHNMATHDVDYGTNHLNNIISVRNRFMMGLLDHPEADPIPDQPPMRFFLMGENRFVDVDSWPLPDTETKAFYLCGNGMANSILGDGALSADVPQGTEKEDTFFYNPLRPVPPCGGNTLCYKPGQRLQEDIEKREDVLVYTSEPLDEDLQVVGEVSAVLYAATSARDTDFFVRLCDVYPDGRSYNVVDGIVRARYRKGTDKEELVTPGEILEYKIDLWSTAQTFKKGHRIRLQVTSSCFPRLGRNHNTGNNWGSDVKLEIARQRVFHSKRYPSRVLLPVVHL